MNKITYLGHACVLFENDDLRLLQDPWLETPAYFNSWFHFPPSVPIKKVPKPTHIYVSHSHQDHLNKESMSQFDKNTEVIIADVEPEFAGQPPVKEQIVSLGFKKITELANFESCKIKDTELTIFVNQYDSGLCVQDAKITMLNTNDCIIEPLMGRIKAKFSPIDFAFMLPIAANAFPQCYVLEDIDDKRHTAQLRDIARFIQRTLYLQPRYVIPFASMYTHFLSELNHLKGGLAANDSLAFLNTFLNSNKKLAPKIKPVLMSPGDYWTNNNGFKKINNFDWNNLNKEYKTAQKRARHILQERKNKEGEFFYTSTDYRLVNVQNITSTRKDRFKTNFSNFITKLLKTAKKDDFRVLFDFGWFKPVVNFKTGKISQSKGNHDWDIYIELSPELFDFFMAQPAEWGNIMLSYRIKIKIKRGFRSYEHILQKYLYDAYLIKN